MTEEDKKYRQGRTFKQREAQYKFMLLRFFII
mgnify:CR=1 FL=1